MKLAGEDELGRSFRRGSPEAVREVRERVGKILRFRGFRIPAEERRDLEQEVMTQVWQAVNRSGFDPERGFWGFVEVVAARRCIDWLRTRRVETVLDEERADTATGPLDSTLAAERTRLASAALARLAEPCRELVYLHVALNKPYRELAGLLGKSEGALRVQMYRCIRDARRILDEMAGKSGARDARIQDP